MLCHCQAQNDTSGAGKTTTRFLLFTLHQIGWNPDKHWGCERWRVTHHSSPLFTLGLRTKLKWKLALFGLRRKSRRFRRWCRFFWGEERWRVAHYSSPVQIPYIQILIPYLWRVKSVFESGLLLRRIAKTEQFLCLYRSRGLLSTSWIRSGSCILCWYSPFTLNKLIVRDED